MKRNRKRAFSLIEAAIVLGIVGLVIGGIWVAAARVNKSLKFSRTQQDILQIVEGVRGLYRHTPLPTSWTDITSVVINAGLAPSDLVNGSTLRSRFESALSVWFDQYPTATTTFWLVWEQRLSLSECVELSVAISRLPNVAYIEIIDALTYSTEWTTFPLTVSDANGACAPGGAGSNRGVMLSLNFP